jgi:hypothetical protein
MKKLAASFALLLCFALAAPGQSGTPKAAPAAAPADVSGMYTFLREGEFVQIDVDGDVVSGFISRYGDSESDRGAFLDQMISKGSLEGNQLSFTTRPVHGVVYGFKGTVERGEGKTPGTEAYYILKGTLTQTTTDAGKKAVAKSSQVVFKSFPADAMIEPKKKD